MNILGKIKREVRRKICRNKPIITHYITNSIFIGYWEIREGMKYILNRNLDPKYVRITEEGYLYMDKCIVKGNLETKEIVSIETPKEE